MSQRELPKEISELSPLMRVMSICLKIATHELDGTDGAVFIGTAIDEYTNKLLTQQARDILGEVDREIIGEDAQEQYYAGEQAPLHDWKAVTQNELREEQRTKLVTLRTKYGVEE